jgi:CheY-like chemotaxis protein
MERSQMTNSALSSDLPSRILLVDDEDSLRNSFYTLLDRDGYEVLAASNGPDGLTIFRQSIRPIELLVTDYNMPRMSGLELARECLSLRCELSVLYISGSSPDEELQADLRAAKRGFLAKPFRGQELLRKTKELLVESSGHPSLNHKGHKANPFTRCA